MKNLFFLALLLFSFTMTTTSCDDDAEVIETVIDSSSPVGDLTVSRAGEIIAQNDTNSQGRVEYGTDDAGTYFVRLGDDFQTVLATGTVTVYLSTSDEFVADPGNGNPDLQLIGLAQTNGELFYTLDSAIDSRFTHLILWCASANIPFGYAALDQN
ncbi:MAG: hypothetical protein AB8G22_05125 [Saprospiraceae bacterium]